MNTLKPLGVSAQTLTPTLQKLSTELKTAQVELKGLEADVGALMVQVGKKEAWLRAKALPAGQEQALYALVKDVAPESAADLRASWEENRRLASVVQSFKSVCNMLSAAGQRADERVLPAAASFQLASRLQMLDDVDTVARGLKAAGVCEAASKFPLAQLTLVRENLTEQINALGKVAPKGPAKLLRAEDVATPAQAGAVIGRLLGDAELGEALAKAADKAADKAGYTRDLGSFALLLDQAGTAPDYSMTRMGWHYPRSRTAYRARQFDPMVTYLSEARLEATLAAGQNVAKAVVKAAEPGAILGEGLIGRFLNEIGVHPKISANWKPSLDGIRKAVEREAVLPLRALNETIQDMADQHGHYDQFRAAVEGVTRSVVEGNYREWRSAHPTSQKQLAVLSPAQQEAWKTADVSASIHAPHGGWLTTREEDDIDLLWLTKIGGPSHGFDYGGHCLMPLLTNARTRAVVVEDEKWPENPAARAYLRLMSTSDGKPVLYLEPLQRDFPHRDAFTQRDLDVHFLAALVDHAAQKAKALGVPLSIDARLDGIAEHLGLDFKVEQRPRFVIAPSAGVVEASDTMTRKHDWVQTREEVITPHAPRLLIRP